MDSGSKIRDNSSYFMGNPSNPMALYLHIPFCAVRCPYCDFNTYSGLEGLFEAYTAALIQEIRTAGAAAGRPPATTLFIGGGTPTVLPADLLSQILAACRESFDLLPDAEITSEANPGTVDQERFAVLRDLGVNRLSMGVQSFDDAELRWLGRIHNAEEAEVAFRAARAAGFANINLDFMFGLPDQAPATWAATLARAIDLGPEHLSLYSLTVEPGTPLADRVRRGQAPAPDDDLAADLYLAALGALADAGYVQYEISNCAKDGSVQEMARTANPEFACRHNLVYWRNEPYFGFGAGAHGFDGRRRHWNVRPVPEYIQRVWGARGPEAGDETIDPRLAQGETMMLGLRLVREGVAGTRFHARFGTGLVETFGAEIAELTSRGLIEEIDGHLRLTPEGRLLGNQVFARFLPDD
jgi:oxygen-independent coproporphyrinogen III oxidase